MSDLNENIDFRPLSEGLGFHQKKSQTPALESPEENFDVPSVDLDSILITQPRSTSGSRAPKSAPVTTQVSAPRTLSVDAPLAPAQVQSFKAEQPQDVDVETLTPVWMRPAADKYNPWAGDVDIGREPSVDGVVERDIENTTVIDNPFFVPQRIGSPVEVVTLRFSGYDGLRNKKRKPVLPSFTAITMDVLTLISMCMIFFAIVLTAMGESLSAVLRELPQDATGRSYFLGIVLTVSFMYMILSRALFGQTIGEWMMHTQLGSDEDRNKASYPIKVFVRTVVVFLSGFIVFPVLSYLVNKDILVYFSGVEMHGEKLDPQNVRPMEQDFSKAVKK